METDMPVLPRLSRRFTSNYWTFLMSLMQIAEQVTQDASQMQLLKLCTLFADQGEPYSLIIIISAMFTMFLF